MVATLYLDVVGLVVDYLEAELNARGMSGPVVARVPNPRPERFTRVRRVGGVRQNVVTDGPMITVECYAPGEDEAVDRAQMARALVHDLPGQQLGGVPVYRVQEIAGVAMLVDPDSQTPRATLTAEVWLRGVHDA